MALNEIFNIFFKKINITKNRYGSINAYNWNYILYIFLIIIFFIIFVISSNFINKKNELENQNLDLVNNFNLGKAGDITNENLDGSWLFAFVKENDQYVIRIRTLNYVFGSVEQNRFYFDKNEIAYNNLTGKIAKDIVGGKLTFESSQVIPLSAGFLAAFIAGLFACTWMINLVKKSKLSYFSLYCFIVGLIAIGYVGYQKFL